MWIRKIERDLKKGVDSPLPTQVVSNEEFLPRPQTRAPEAARGADRRDGRGARAQAQHGPPRVHGQLDGPGHLLRRVQPRVRQGLRRRRGRDLRARGDRREVSEERVLRHRRAGALHQRHRAELPQQRDRPQHGLQPQGRRRVVQLQELRQGDVLRQRDQHGGDLRRADARDPAHARRQGRGRRAAQFAVRDPAELADGREEERDQRNGRLAARAVPGQPRAEPLLGQGDQQHRQGRDDRADGARAAAVQDRLVEVVLPHRPGAHRQRLPARRRQRDVVLRGVAQARHEAVQRAQGLLLPVAHARPPGEPEGRREGGARAIPTSTSSSTTRRSSTGRTSRTTSTATSSTRRPATSSGTRS